MDSFLRHGRATIAIPSGWEDTSEVILRDTSRQLGFATNLVYSNEPTQPAETASMFAARQLALLQLQLDDYELLREGEATFGPNTGYVREHTFAASHGTVVQLQFYVVKDERAHTFTVTDEKANAGYLLQVGGWLLSRVRIDGSAGDLQE